MLFKEKCATDAIQIHHIANNLVSTCENLLNCYLKRRPFSFRK